MHENNEIHSHIFGESGVNHEKGRKNMARNSRVTLGLFMAAAVMAFGGLSGDNAAQGADYEWTGGATIPNNSNKWNETATNWKIGNGGNIPFAGGDNSNVTIDLSSLGAAGGTIFLQENDARTPYSARINDITLLGNITLTEGRIVSISGNLFVSAGDVNIGSDLSLVNGAIEVAQLAKLTLNNIEYRSELGRNISNLIVDGELDLSSQKSDGARGKTITIANLTGNTSEAAITGLDQTFELWSGNYAGAIDGSNVNLVKNDGHTLTLTGENGYTGSTIVNDGVLALVGNGSISASSGVTINNNAQFTIEKTGENVGDTEIKALYNEGGQGVTNIKFEQANLTLTGTGEDMGTYNGTIQGAGGLKLNAENENAIFALNSDKAKITYEGVTDITSGTLKLGADGDFNNRNGNTLAIRNRGKLDVSSKVDGYTLESTLSDSASDNGEIVVGDGGMEIESGGNYHGDFVHSTTPGKGPITIANSYDPFNFYGTNNAGKTLVDSGAIFNLYGNLNHGLDVYGKMTSYTDSVVNGGAVVDYHGDLTTSGTINGDLTVRGNSTATNDGRINGGIIVDGSIATNKNGGNITGGLTLTTDGGVMTNEGGGLIGGGAIVNNGTFNNEETGIINGKVVQNGGLIFNDGDMTGGVQVNDQTFTNRGTVSNGAEITGGELINSNRINGNVTVGKGISDAKLTMLNDTHLDGVTPTINGNLTVGNNGTADVDGRVAGHMILEDSGTMIYKGGNNFSVGGDLIAGSNSTMNLYVGGADGKTFNTIAIDGKVDIDNGGMVNFDLINSNGSYTLFNANNGVEYNKENIALNNVGTGGYLIDTFSNGTELRVLKLEDQQYLQYWQGGGKNGENPGNIWNDDTAKNWSGVYWVDGDGIEYSENPSEWRADLDHEKGWVAVFGSDGLSQQTVKVDGTQVFEKLQFANDGYIITGNNASSDQLAFVPITNHSAATIEMQNGSSAIIDVVLADNHGSYGNYGLDVTGDGKLTLTKANTYTGDTTLKNSVTLVMQDANSIGDDNGKQLIFASDGSYRAEGAKAVLDFNGTFNHEIVDNNTVGYNTVEIAAGKSVTLAEENNYNADTVIDDGATLIANSDGVLSENSYHELGNLSVLDVQGGKQTIGGLSGEENSVVKLASGTSLTVDNTSATRDNGFDGHLVGSGDLINTGSALGVKLYETGYSNDFTGRFYNSINGALTITGEENADLDLRIGTNTEKDGVFNIYGDREITLIDADRGQGKSFNGTINIQHGLLILDSSAKSLLQPSSTLGLYGSEAGAWVDGTYTIGDLSLNGSNVFFESEKLFTNPAKLNVGTLDLNDITNVFIDENMLTANVNTYNLFELDRGVREFVIEADKVTGTGNVAVKDLNGNDFKNPGDAEIVQNGTQVGIAYFDVTSGLEPSGTGTKGGVYYGQNLTKIISDPCTQNVELNSTPTEADKYDWEGSRYDYLTGTYLRPSTTAEMSAQLTGGGGYDFTGSRNILVSKDPETDDDAVNNYAGSTVVNMDDADLTVTAGYNFAFGSTGAMDIQRGRVIIDGTTQNVTYLSGTTDGSIRIGSYGNAGKLSINNTLADEGIFNGLVCGYGEIIKTGNGVQQFLNDGNHLTGNLTVENGSLTWAGNLIGNATVGAANDNRVAFTQRGSYIDGNVNVLGNNSTLNGYGAISGNLTIGSGAAYLVTTTSGTIDKTTVIGQTNFENGSDFRLSDGAKSYLLLNPGTSGTELLTSAGGITTGNPEWQDGVITTIDMGILGEARVIVGDNSITYDGVSAPVDPIEKIRSGWAAKGINVNDLIERSNLAEMTVQTVQKYLDSEIVKTDPVVNARYANAKFIGLMDHNGLSYSKKDVLSLMNYDSGYTATLPVQAALDTGRSFGQGLKNRINNLRAARTIMSDMFSGFGYTQPMGAYGNGIVQDTFGYGAPAYLGTAYYDPYSGMTQAAAPMQAQQYGYNYGYEQQQPVYGYGQQYIPGYSSTNIWAGGIGSWTKQKTSKGGIGGYTYDQGGVMVGVDHIAGDFVIGAAFGYSHGKLEDKEAISSDTKINAYAANLYADYNHETGFNAMFFGGFAWMDNKVNRTVAGYRNDGSDGLYRDNGREKSKYDSHALYLGTNFSYDWLPTDRLTVTPSIGVEYYQARSKAHDRNLVRNSGVILSDHVSAVRGHSLSAPIDVTVTYDVVRSWDTKVSLMANAGYAYEFHNKGPKGHLTWNDVEDSPVMSFYGRKPGRNGWNFGAGARLQKKNISFDVKYDFAHRKDVTNHRVGANISWEF